MENPPGQHPPTQPLVAHAPIGPTYGGCGPHPPGTDVPWAHAPYRAGPYLAIPHQPPRRARPLPFRPMEVGAAIGVAVLADVTLWSKETPASGGFGLALLFVTLPVLAFAAARAWRASVRLGVVVALLAMVSLRCMYAPTFGVACSGLALIVAFALALRARSLFVPDVIASAFAAIALVPSRVGAATAGVQALAARTRLGKVSVLPIVIPAALVAVFLGVFALANPVVAHGLGALWSALGNVIAIPSGLRVTLWVVALVGAACLLRPACRLARGSETAATTGEAAPTSLLVARNALVGLNVLFLGYNALDARYLWAGSPPSGMHTQQYAHQGAIWLTVALLMLTAVIGVMFRGALAHDARAATSRSLAFAWIAQGLVLSFGTYRRIAIHIAKSGLSDLRIVGILGTSLVVCGVILVALKLRRGKAFTWLLRRQLDALAITAIVYGVTPTHLLSASVNVARIEHGEYRPILHTFRQSHETESAAILIPLLDHEDLRVRQGVAVLLADERRSLQAAVAKQATWRERDLATSHALSALDDASTRIDAALGEADPSEARSVLWQLSRVANEDRSLEELLAIPAAAIVRR